MKGFLAILIVISIPLCRLARAYTTSEKAFISRRGWFRRVAGTTSALSNAAIVVPNRASAKTSESNKESPLEQLLEAQNTLDKLLSNWKRATIDCTYADVPRELLESKNKELLLEKASTFALFDKSVSVETCKTTNRIVRDYLGVTGKGPLVGIDKQLRKGLDFIDPDDLEIYVNGECLRIKVLSVGTASLPARFSSLSLVLPTELENFSQSYSKASSLSYAAGTADFDSVNNFSKDAINDTNSNSNLEQAKEAITQAKGNLDTIVGMLQKAASEA